MPGADRAHRRSADLLDAYDRQLRGSLAHQTSPGVTVEVEGQIVRALMGEGQGMVTATGVSSLGESAAASLIRSQIAVFATLHQPFEWKTWAHDHPHPFLQLLLDFGFSSSDEESVLVARSSEVAEHRAQLPAGANLRQLRPGPDFRTLEEQLTQAFGEAHRDHAAAYEAAVIAFPDRVFLHGVLVDQRLAATGRLELVDGSEFGTMWGGSVVPAWRHHGLYRALVSHRAQLACGLGFPLLEVDALPTSRPTLERLGFLALTSTTPFTWDPVASPLRAVR